MKNLPQIAGGVAGAAVGFAATLLIVELVGSGNRADPIGSALLAVFVFAPAGAIAGLVLGTKLAMRMRGGENTGSLAGNSLRAFGALILLCAAAGTAYYVYAVTTATPWLNPNAATPLLQFEVRLPAGAALPAAAADVAVELQTDQNSMPGVPRLNQFRRDGERPVIAGDVELAFRTAHRQLEVKIKGQPARVYRIGLTAKAPHAAQLGPWQPNADGSEIRYRAKWPGRD
ncbi:hypothetical protein JQ629_13225 [Bradyrhizobium sp. AUGA SZCCT0222]|uniref:hypothetical protein n=1 Tax=Bradyrhizobium sp. AUGA SZCCT0222 TaxID=2807668 RepID=UPI001BAA6335|nr:hypothetical protein [Bradyrhizobium sp. AUGA SZCCT0222]MBR1268474.1 hypothetical protein [Bradyrhizobium sp. AUGA SZCCT0222]